MSQAASNNLLKLPSPKVPSALQELQKKMAALRGEMLDEKKRVKKERTHKREHVHALCILGKLIAHHGKERIRKALDEAPWLKSEDRQAVEYYFELRERPKVKTPKVPEQSATAGQTATQAQSSGLAQPAATPQLEDQAKATETPATTQQPIATQQSDKEEGVAAADQSARQDPPSAPDQPTTSQAEATNQAAQPDQQAS